MAQQVNSKMFKNTSTGKKKMKFDNPFVPLIIIIILALLSVWVQYIVIDINTAMNKQIQEELQKESMSNAQTEAGAE